EARPGAPTRTKSRRQTPLLPCSLHAARRQAAVRGRELLEGMISLLERTRAEIRAIDGLDVLDERLARRPGGFANYPPRLAVGGGGGAPAAGGGERPSPPPPRGGELVLPPRGPYLGPQEVVPAPRAAGRVAAES